MTRSRFGTIPFIALIVVAAMPSVCFAQAASSEVRTTFGLSVNNLGLQQSLQMTWRKGRTVIGLEPSITPAMLRFGGWAEVTPVPMLVIRGGAESSLFFGTFNSLMSFDRRDEAFDPDSRKLRGGAGPGAAHRYYVQPTLRLRAGPIVAASSFQIERWSASVDGPYFYEPSRDTLFATAGDTATYWSTLLLHETVRPSGATFRWGGFHSLQRVNRSDLNRVQRLGAIFIATATGRRWKLTEPAVTLLVARYLDDPSKSGGWTVGLQIGKALK